MKHKLEAVVLLGLTAYLGYFAYSHIRKPEKQDVSDLVENISASATPAPQEVVIEQVKIVDSPMSRVDEKPKNLAPPGVFYLLIAKSIEFDSGVTSYKIGTKVTKLSDGKVRAPDGTVLSAKDEEITNDLDLIKFLVSIRPPESVVSSESAPPPTTPPLTKATPPPKIQMYENPLNAPTHDKTDFGLKNEHGDKLPFIKKK